MSKVKSVSNPSREELLELLDEGLITRSLIVIFARCRVHYDGRAKSELGPGDRVIMIKPDGTFLVHQKEKREPVNWQPPGSFVSFYSDGDHLVLRSLRKKPRENLGVELDEVYMASIFRAEDYEALALTGSEAEMLEMLFNNPEMIEPGFKALFKEKDIGRGIVDLLGRDANGNLVVVELKRRKADLHAVSQLKRYVEALKKESENVRGILVAPSITEGAKKLLEKEGLEFRAIKPPKREKRGWGRQTTLF
ncbi:endonuclease NucS [Thermococcus sp.]